MFRTIYRHVASFGIANDTTFLSVMAKGKSAIRLQRVINNVFRGVASSARKRNEQVGMDVAGRRLFRSVVLSHTYRGLLICTLFSANASRRYRGQGGNAIRYRKCKRLIRQGTYRRSVRVGRKTSKCTYFTSIASGAKIVHVVTTINQGIGYSERPFLTYHRISTMRHVEFFDDKRPYMLTCHP